MSRSLASTLLRHAPIGVSIIIGVLVTQAKVTDTHAAANEAELHSDFVDVYFSRTMRPYWELRSAYIPDFARMISWTI